MGLIKTALKTAVAVKTAHYVHGRIQERQDPQWAGRAGHAAGSTAPGDMPGTLAMLDQLGALKANGVLTDVEFESQKARILHSP